MKELQITVAGQANTGKTTMLLWLEEFLLKQGFSVEMNMETELLDYGTEENLRIKTFSHTKERREAIKENTKIILTSKQTQRVSQGN